MFDIFLLLIKQINLYYQLRCRKCLTAARNCDAAQQSGIILTIVLSSVVWTDKVYGNRFIGYSNGKSLNAKKVFFYYYPYKN